MKDDLGNLPVLDTRAVVVDGCVGELERYSCRRVNDSSQPLRAVVRVRSLKIDNCFYFSFFECFQNLLVTAPRKSSLKESMFDCFLARFLNMFQSF